MATAKEIKEHLDIALREVGKIEPWFDPEVNEWIFSHPLYPVEYGGSSKKEVIQNYPKYLREFIKQRLNENLSPLTEKKTTGHGGKRVGAGRPKGTVKEPTRRLTLPNYIADIVVWMCQHPESIAQIRKFMQHN